MKLSELFGRAELEFPPESGDIEITQIVTDSRKAVEGCLFICIKGLHSDGLEYVNDAIKAGARVIVAERVCELCVGGAAAYIMLDNTRKATALLYNAWYGKPTEKLKIIGVTGTNGKTSVCTLLSELFENAGYRCGVIGTIRNYSADRKTVLPHCGNALANMTTPDPEDLYALLARMAEDQVEYVFMEVTSHALALHKVDAIQFDTAIFTNLTQDHLDFHGNMEEYFRAKQRLFTMCRRAIVNGDGEAGERLVKYLKDINCPAVTCSVTDGDYCALYQDTKRIDGVSYRLQAPREGFDVFVGIAGCFTVINSLLAAATALEYGISCELIQKSFKQTKGVKGRMERVALPSTAEFSVLIDYAHTPDALEKLLKTVRDFRRKGERIVLIFGCGGDRDRSKRKEMAIIASRLSDHVIVTSDNSRSEDPKTIISDILKGMDKEKSFTVIPCRREAIELAVLRAKKGDIIVLAGKGHETYEINAKGRLPFDEREFVKSAFERKRSLAEKNT